MTIQSLQRRPVAYTVELLQDTRHAITQAHTHTAGTMSTSCIVLLFCSRLREDSIKTHQKRGRQTDTERKGERDRERERKKKKERKWKAKPEKTCSNKPEQETESQANPVHSQASNSTPPGPWSHSLAQERGVAVWALCTYEDGIHARGNAID